MLNMKVRLIKKPNITGIANRFNTCSKCEVIIGYDGADMDSVYVSELEVLIHKIVKIGFSHKVIKLWMPMKEAFRNKDLITDDMNTEFFEPHNKEDRVRGYTL
jgi:hypothetical protein